MAIFFSAPAQAVRKPVYVAAYDFPPFFSATLETDLTTELVGILNRHQTTYEFIIQAIPPNGRYQALSQQGCCDVIFFESQVWGWNRQDVDVESTIPLLKGRERLVTKATPRKTQSYFDDMKGKTLGGVKGYHYLIAGEVLNSAEVAERYQIYLSDSRITNLRMLIGDRIDATVMNDELLAALKNSSVNYLDQLMLADEPQHEYELGIVVSDGKAISVGTMQRLIREVSREGLLDTLFLRFNLQRFQLNRR